jgi:hypothetical protein
MRARNVNGSHRRCAATAWIGVLAVTLSAGCSKGPPPIKGTKLSLYPVTGKLLMDGQPMTRATIIFHPIKEWPKGTATSRPRAVVDKDGTFKVSTYANADGAPAGDYKVTISWKGEGKGLSGEQLDDEPEKAPEIFQEPKRSKIRVKIKEGDNTLPTWDLSKFESRASNSP